MRRWNGWGDDAVSYDLPAPAVLYLETSIGKAPFLPDVAFDRVVGAVGASRLVPDARISTEAAERVRHARGQSLPDWVALRSGRISAIPDGVAFPDGEADARGLLDYARNSGARLIPYGGGTSVAGHINPRPEDAPVLTVDLRRLNRLLELDETSRLATFEAGVTGPDLERQLIAKGCRLGHYPQSWEFSTLGGWIATRSSGQQSYRYGRIEDLFAGGHVETPEGPLQLLPLPASAAGPDLRQMVLGSEGRFGIITRGTVRVRRVPEVDRFHGVIFRDWESGAAAVREVAQSEIPVSMLRLSDARETEVTLRLSGKDRLIEFANRGLGVLGYGEGRCLLILGITGETASCTIAYRAASAMCRRHRGLPTGIAVGNAWRRRRFLAPYLRNTLWELGYALDTLETALPWSKVMSAASAIRGAIVNAFESWNERALVFAHLSHAYIDGASIYFTCVWRRGPDPDRTLAQWKTMKDAASAVIVAQGGSISHQHGVGADHAAYLKAEKGETGIRMLEAVRQSLDPGGILNPGKLLE